nr:gliding motility-associated C-terminal domain-containing protein [Saprospiraceae bacterium]HMQ82214.1 gliding motility-associated C-terminal domain-containing protein [Saprospiraceae bacterium]
PACGENNGQLVFSASGGTPPYLYSLNGGIFQSSATFSGLGAGVYTATVLDQSGCVSVAEQLVLENQSDLSVAIIETFQPECNQSNGEITLVGNGGVEPYAYSLDGITFQENNTFSNLIAGVYELYVLDDTGCLDVVEIELMIADVGLIQAETDSLTINSSDQTNSIDVLANDDFFDPVNLILLPTAINGQAFVEGLLINYEPQENAAYTDTLFYVICDADCTNVCDTAMVLVSVHAEDDFCDLNDDLPDNLFPEGITPNGDDLNDVLEFVIVDPAVCPFVYQNSEVVIFNRWGDRVYEASPYDNDWNGKHQNGQELSSGVYYYVLRVEALDYLRMGTVTIFR